MRSPGYSSEVQAEGLHRIFIAVPLAEHIREAVEAVRRPFARYGDSLRWVLPEHLHLTLQFLGNITTPSLAEAVTAAHETAATESPFTIVFAGVGAFPSLAAPRVVWVGVGEGADRLTALARRLGTALQGHRFSLDDRPFAPHLTLARVRGGGRPPNLGPEAEALRQIVMGRQLVDEMVVMKSLLGSGHPTYSVVANAPFGVRS